MMKTSSTIRYSTKSGKLYDFDINTCYTKFGVKHNSIVITPKGSSTVVGVYNDYIWFHIDGEAGATYWDNIRCFSDLIDNGFKIPELDILPEDDNDFSEYSTQIESHAPPNFSEIFNNKNQYQHLSDFTIIVGSEKKKFQSHKIILCEASKFFKAMLFSNMCESTQNFVTLPHISEEMFQNILEFIYCGKTVTNNVIELIEIAIFLEITTLIDVCMRVIKSNIALSTVFPLLEVSIKLNLKNIQDECMSLISRKCSILMKNEKKLQFLTKQGLAAILQLDVLLNISEMELFKAIISWTGSQCVERKAEIVELTQFIRFKDMTSEELLEVESYNLFNEKEFSIIRSKNPNRPTSPINSRNTYY